MPATYSPELIQEIQTLVIAKQEELEAMNREELNKEYLEKIGTEPHPRFHLDQMVKMIARVYQGEYWTERTGDIPAEIRKNDMEFWLNQEAFFTPKAAIREERAKPITARTKKKKIQPQGPRTLPGSRGTGLQSKAKNLEDAILFLHRAPKDNNPDILAAADILKGAPDTRLAYDVFATHCKKKKIGIPPNMLVLLMKRQGIIELIYPQEPELQPVPETQDEDEDSMSFKEVLANIETSAPKLLVESNSVDFGHGDRVGNY